MNINDIFSVIEQLPTKKQKLERYFKILTYIDNYKQQAINTIENNVTDVFEHELLSAVATHDIKYFDKIIKYVNECIDNLLNENGQD